MGKSKRKRRNNPRQTELDGPAKAGPGQVFLLEPVSGDLGAPRRYNNIGSHPLHFALARKKITDQQFAAGDLYRRLFELREASGKDSTVQSTGSGNHGAPWSQQQVNAIMRLKAIEKELSRTDRIIVRKFCGEGWSMIDALRATGRPFSEDGVIKRICEALEELGEAILTAARTVHTPSADEAA